MGLINTEYRLFVLTQKIEDLINRVEELEAENKELKEKLEIVINDVEKIEENTL